MQMTDQMTHIAKTLDNQPPTIPDRSAVPKQEDLPSTIPSLFDMLPDSMKAHVVQYLQFEDMTHEGELKLEGSHIPEGIMFQYMQGGTDFDEPVRFIFKDFDKDFESTDIDVGRLEKLKALMRNVNLQSYLSFWQSITDYTLSYERIGFIGGGTYDSAYYDRLVDQIKAAEDCPPKEHILSRLGNAAELRRILSRGRCRVEYTPTLPPVFFDVFGRIITRGDKESVLLFDQLVSHPTLKKSFVYDLREDAFLDKLAQVSQTGGQSHVLLHDDVIGMLRDVNLMDNQREILSSAVSHGRCDVLDGTLNVFLKKETHEFYRLFGHMFREILDHSRPLPDCDVRLAKDLVTNNMDNIRKYPEFAESLLVEMLYCHLYNTTRTLNGRSIQKRRETPERESLLHFVMDQFNKVGVQIRAEKALEVAGRCGNDFYNEYFIKNFPA